MLGIVALIFSLMLIGAYWITKDMFHPSVVVSGVWATLLILYLYLDHPLWDLSNNFCLAISLWVVPFYYIVLFLGQTRIVLSDHETTCPYVNTRLYNKLYPYAILYSIGFIIALVYYAGGRTLIDIRSFMVEQEFPPFLQLLFYLNTAFIVYVMYGVLNIELLGKKKVVVLLLILLVVSFFKSNKTSFLSMFVSLLYILNRKHKLKISYVIVAILLLVVLLSAVTLSRGDIDSDEIESSGAVERFLYIYLLSPLTAFDVLINGESHLNAGTFGSGVFSFFYKIINAFGANYEIADLGEWVMVPLPTNVFTVMRGYYLDNGYYGILMGSVIMGIIWGILYRLQKKNYALYTVFYATMISSLFFQSFGDYFFYTFSVTIQYFIFSLIMVRGIKFGNKYYS